MSDRTPQSHDAGSGGGTPSDGTASQFVSWQHDEASIRKARARLYHKKSRNGCQQCRARHVKCDEVHPVCGSCKRHQVTCVYGRPGWKRTSENRPGNKSGNSNAGNPNVLDLPDDSPEARARRMLELKLLYQYATKTGRSISMPCSGPNMQAVREVWIRAIPRLAFRDDSLLYAVYAIASMHIAHLEPPNVEMIEASSRYLYAAIKIHRKAITQLQKDNADAACLTSSIVRLCAFAMLQERDFEPYTAPIQWISMTHEAGGVFLEAWKLIHDDPTSLTRVMIANAPEITGNGAVLEGKKPWELEATFGERNRQGLNYLLERSENDVQKEPWSLEIKEAYQTTLNLIDGLRLGINANKNAGDILRLLILFPMMIQQKFIDLLKDEQPRAYIVLAHYFALLGRFKTFWWIGDAPRREIQGIRAVISPEWQHFLDWPLKILEEEQLLVPDEEKSVLDLPF